MTVQPLGTPLGGKRDSSLHCTAHFLGSNARNTVAYDRDLDLSSPVRALGSRFSARSGRLND